jgi:hypothetical protein
VRAKREPLCAVPRIDAGNRLCCTLHLITLVPREFGRHLCGVGERHADGLPVMGNAIAQKALAPQVGNKAPRKWNSDAHRGRPAAEFG